MSLKPEIRNTLTTAAVMLLIRTLLAGTPVYAEPQKIHEDNGLDHKIGLVEGQHSQQESEHMQGITKMPIETRFLFAPGQFVTIQLELGVHEELNNAEDIIHYGKWGVPPSSWKFKGNGTFLDLTATDDQGRSQSFHGESQSGGPAQISETVFFNDDPNNPNAASAEVVTDGDRVTGESITVNGQEQVVTGHVFFGEDMATGEEWWSLQNQPGDWEAEFHKPGYRLRVGLATLTQTDDGDPTLQMPTQWFDAGPDGVVRFHADEECYFVFSLVPVEAN